MTHIHSWKRDASRKHKRPPRFFVKCGCGESRQAVISYGHLTVFHTGRNKIAEDHRKKVRTIRLSDKDMKDVENGNKRLIVVENRITIAV